MTWDQVDGITARAVRRGLLRRKRETIERIGVDETSFRKRQRYVTVVTDLSKGRVLHVADERRMASLDSFYRELTPEPRSGIQAVAMDMWKSFMSSTREFVPDANRKIAFDKFHVAKHLGDAVDAVRRKEHRSLLEDGDPTLTGSKCHWLTKAEKLGDVARETLDLLRSMSLKTARAWAIKETAMSLWRYVRRGWARRAWKQWIGWAIRSRLEPLKRVACMVRDHLWGIVNAIVLGATNARSESTAARVQRIKRMACGLRNRGRFRNAILFHLGGLDLYPASVTHTDS